jgi:hypothetical protein
VELAHRQGGTQTQEQFNVATGDTITLEGGKKEERCTPLMWKYFFQEIVVVEADGKKYDSCQVIATFPKCKQKYIVMRLLHFGTILGPFGSQVNQRNCVGLGPLRKFSFPALWFTGIAPRKS